ncbi:unnamed protein product [Psylliodes chrysocephalus]|uniref:Uncharacterized protein n=1 Tax=Psylliodes chrysocephalus TaxID=3402493 RepID=A0A9P0CV99_9CUCU|nr:unnamed protein product [Psylliodes chrysocephala]
MPLTKDIQKLHKYLTNEGTKAVEKLVKMESVKAFEMLTETTLVRTILLNRKRVGDVQFIQYSDYNRGCSIDKHSDTYNMLSEAEKALSQNMIRLEAHHLFKKFSIDAQCEAPETLRSTKLRKHIAITVQLLNLRENELDAFAKFMGHDIRVHRQYYRLQNEAIDLEKISKVLIKMEKGNIDQMREKNLDEIEVDDVVEGEVINPEEEENMEEDWEDEEMKNVAKRGECTILNSDLNSISKIKMTSKKVVQKINKGHNVNVKPKKIVKKIIWSKPEADLILNYYRKYLVMKTLPGKFECEKFLNENKLISTNRTWTNVKDFIYNQIRRH